MGSDDLIQRSAVYKALSDYEAGETDEAAVIETLYEACTALEEQVEALKNELQIAIDDHDCRFGRSSFVGHWTNTARALINKEPKR